MLAESLKNEIIEDLRTIDPFKVILFGSYAYGIPNEDSDIDLYIVTKENFVPISFEENLRIKMNVYRALDNFRKKSANLAKLRKRIRNDTELHRGPQRFTEKS